MQIVEQRLLFNSFKAAKLFALCFLSLSYSLFDANIMAESLRGYEEIEGLCANHLFPRIIRVSLETEAFVLYKESTSKRSKTTRSKKFSKATRMQALHTLTSLLFLHLQIPLQVQKATRRTTLHLELWLW